MIHLGARAFDEIGGEVVQSTAFTLLKNNKKSEPKPPYSSSSTSYYRDYRTGYTVESHTNSHGGNAVIRDAKGRIISTTRMSW